MKGSCCCLATGGSCSVALVSSHLSHTSSLHQSMSTACALFLTPTSTLTRIRAVLLSQSPGRLCISEWERRADMECLCWFSTYHNEPKVGEAWRLLAIWSSRVPSDVKKRVDTLIEMWLFFVSVTQDALRSCFQIQIDAAQPNWTERVSHETLLTLEVFLTWHDV